MITTHNRQTLMLILIAFFFSFAFRLIWVFQFQDYEQFHFNNQFMINTNDGYFFAEGARDIIAGESQENDLSPIDNAVSITTAFFATILPFSFESIIFYMPAFLASLIVIPMILIGKALKHIEVGFVAALFGAIAHSYYNRTMIGYYDTDMLNIVFPVFLLWSLIFALQTREEKYILFSGLEIVAYRWWYPQSYSLEFAFIALVIAYTLYLLYKKEDIRYELLLLGVMFFAMMGLDNLVRLGIVLVLYLLIKQEIVHKWALVVFGFALLSFLATGGLHPVMVKIDAYFFAGATSATGSDLSLHFYNVVGTVREAGKIPFDVFANRISGHSVTFILAIGGYLWLAYNHRVMLLGLPLLGLGFLAYAGGLRFTIYAVPVLAFGIAYLIYKLSSLTNTEFKKYFFMSLLSLAALLPNIFHIVEYKVPTVLMRQEVQVLDQLKNIAQREDYVAAWWDYGYPIRYYSDTKTLIDGAKHSGSDNFATSFLLTNPQTPAARMARLDVEYTETKFNLPSDAPEKYRTNLANMVLDYGFSDANDFLAALSLEELKLPEKTRDVYLYLPNRMMGIYPTITYFSNLDLMSGTQGAQPFYHFTTLFEEDQGYIYLGYYNRQDIRLNKATGNIEIDKARVAIAVKDFTLTYYDANENLQVTSNEIKFDGKLHLVYMKSYNQFLVVDESVYNSTYFRLFVLEDYDAALFEPTILTPHTKIYKLKI